MEGRWRRMIGVGLAQLVSLLYGAAYLVHTHRKRQRASFCGTMGLLLLSLLLFGLLCVALYG